MTDYAEFDTAAFQDEVRAELQNLEPDPSAGRLKGFEFDYEFYCRYQMKAYLDAIKNSPDAWKVGIDGQNYNVFAFLVWYYHTQLKAYRDASPEDQVNFRIGMLLYMREVESWFRKFRQGFKWRLCSPAA